MNSISEQETDLVLEALHDLLTQKQKALTLVNESLPLIRLGSKGTPFTPHDFGIPTIEQMIARFSA